MKKWIQIWPQMEKQMPDDDTPALAPQDALEKPPDAEEAGDISIWRGVMVHGGLWFK